MACEKYSLEIGNVPVIVVEGLPP